jgi:hypothetical protein
MIGRSVMAQARRNESPRACHGCVPTPHSSPSRG